MELFRGRGAQARDYFRNPPAPLKRALNSSLSGSSSASTLHRLALRFACTPVTVTLFDKRPFLGVAQHKPSRCTGGDLSIKTPHNQDNLTIKTCCPCNQEDMICSTT